MLFASQKTVVLAMHYVRVSSTAKILFMPESTEGVAEGATTAMGQEKCEECSK